MNDESPPNNPSPDEPSRPQPSLVLSVAPVLFLVAALAVTIVWLKQPAHIPLILATAMAGLVAFGIGYTWRDLLSGITRGITIALPACLILLVIGTLIGTWILSGIVPTLIVYGLKIVSPSYFLVTACVVCAVVALATGSSWSTAGTVGIALIGIAETLGIPRGMAAGAILSGAYFGDKMSPLSDTTNLAPAVAGTELFTHIRHMVYTAGPSLVIALVAYFIIGLWYQGPGSEAKDVAVILKELETRFVIHWALLLPLVAVIVLVALRIPALPALLVGTILGGLCAAIAQSASLTEIVKSAQSGYVSTTGIGSVDKLLSRGGLESMMSTVALILCALSFGGIMERAGMLRRLAETIMTGAKRTGSLVLRTLLTSIGMNVLAADQYMAIVVPGRMYRDAYAAQGLHPKNLSRCLEDAGTMTSALVPWNTCGAYMSTTLGVSTFAYLPFAFVNLLNPVISVVLGYTGWTMHKADPSGAPVDDAGDAEPDGHEHDDA
jgi:NhaC family Na+:H+ antiporter